MAAGTNERSISVAGEQSLSLESSFVHELGELCIPWQAARAPAPKLLALNGDLADDLGVDVGWLGSPEGVDVLVGNKAPEGATTVAQAYAGHQFGGYSPRLGDGRALLLGEIIDPEGGRRDLHLKGSGRTPFARGGDGKAAVGPMLREYVIGESMHALGIPTSRALAVVATGEEVVRETMLPGAVLARVAASHIRVGTFEYAAAQQDPELVRRLADYAIARHHPGAADAENPYLAFFDAVLDAQASLVARWLLVGFIHGVMNTDNMALSGETIDYGPCAFMETFDPATVFSSIDHGGRYAYGNQPRIAAWNLARLAESLLVLIDDDTEAAVGTASETLGSFWARHERYWVDGMRAKLGIRDSHDGDGELIRELLALMQTHHVDYTSFFRSLPGVLTGDRSGARALVLEPADLDVWLDRWLERVSAQDLQATAIAEEMNRTNPAYIPRNHRVEEALAAATAGEMEPFERLVAAVSHPYEDRPGLEHLALPAPESFGPYRTFCGT